MTHARAHGEEVIKDTGDLMLATLYTDMYQPVVKYANNTLIRKKGDFKTYRPIILLPLLYKIFPKIMLNRA